MDRLLGNGLLVSGKTIKRLFITVRSFLYPSLTAFGYWLVKQARLDDTILLYYIPRLIQSIFAGISDYFLYKLASKYS